MTLAKIKTQIRQVGTISELNELIEFIDELKNVIGKSQISVGSKVYVVQKTKRTLGTVKKMKVKNALVELPEGLYNVPFSMLEAA